MGTGRIGAAMARICCGFGMTVLACDQYRNPALDGLVRYVGLEELLRTADLVSLHCPLTAETYHMINAETIRMMRDSAVLVNTSRGGLIDTRALINALRSRKFAGVGLDVYEDEDGQVFENFSDDVLRLSLIHIFLSVNDTGDDGGIIRFEATGIRRAEVPVTMADLNYLKTSRKKFLATERKFMTCLLYTSQSAPASATRCRSPCERPSGSRRLPSGK